MTWVVLMVYFTSLTFLGDEINHPEEVLNLDEKINVVVLDFDDDKKRISLGMKHAHPHILGILWMLVLRSDLR